MDAGVTVAAYEKVTVRAGQFDAFKIEAKGKSGQEGPPARAASGIHRTSWYAPSARAIVKQVYRDPVVGERAIELASFKLQP